MQLQIKNRKSICALCATDDVCTIQNLTENRKLCAILFLNAHTIFSSTFVGVESGTKRDIQVHFEGNLGDFEGSGAESNLFRNLNPRACRFQSTKRIYLLRQFFY